MSEPNEERNFLCVPLYKFDDLPDHVQSHLCQKEVDAWREHGFNETTTDMLQEQLSERGLPNETVLWGLSGHTYVRFAGTIDLKALVNAPMPPREDLKEDIQKLLAYNKADVQMEIVMLDASTYYPRMEVEMTLDWVDEDTGAGAIFRKPFETAAQGVQNRISSYAANVCYDLLKMVEQDYSDTSWAREHCIEQDLWYLPDGTEAGFLFINSRQEVLDGDFREATEVFQKRQEALLPENQVCQHVGRQLRR